MQHLVDYGFKNIDFDYKRVVYYMPDVEKDSEVAKSQIKRNFECKLYNALFNLNRAKNKEQLSETLLNLLEKQYQKRLEMYDNNQKIFDFQSSNTIIISAEK